jgi:hypothetical protein
MQWQSQDWKLKGLSSSSKSVFTLSSPFSSSFSIFFLPFSFDFNGVFEQ